MNTHAPLLLAALSLACAALCPAANTFPASGNAGIGTTTPLDALSVYAGNGYAAMSWVNGFIPNTTVGSRWRFMTDPAGSFSLQALSNTAGSTVVTYTASGNIGIHNADPKERLSLSKCTNFLDRSWGWKGMLFNQYLGQNDLGNYVWYAALTGHTGMFMWDTDNGAFRFFTQPVTTVDANGVSPVINPAEVFCILNSGNVGIGRKEPAEKLEVNGKIRCKEVIVETVGNWSDHVFASDYRLAPLSEVESHIRANGHLPGIPSAAEVAENGVAVVDMQSRLLAKVEELTLHLIRLQKEVDSLKSENAALQAGPR